MVTIMKVPTFRFVASAFALLAHLVVAVPGEAEPVVLQVRSDGGDGAYATIEAARDALRKARAAGALADGAEVRIHRGIYTLDSALKFTKEDSGTADAPIRYVAASGEVRLMGGRKVSGFAPLRDEAALARLPASARKHVWTANLKKQGIEDFGVADGRGIELFYGGQRMKLARWPNEGFTTIVDVPKLDVDVRGTKGSVEGKFTYKGRRPGRWVEESDPWVHGYWFWDWSEQRHQIDTIDVENQSLALKPPYHNYGYRKGQWYYAYNLLSELDSPGEWYLDRDEGVLYFWPPDDPSSAEPLVTLLPTLVDIDGASHLTLQGFVLEGTRRTAIRVHGGEGVQLAALTVRNSGGGGIRISGGTKHTVEGCDLYGLGGAGVVVYGGDRKTLQPAGHRVLNCHIHHYAEVQRVYAAGISLNGVGNLAAHNRIHDAPHMAIGFGGNDHIIEYNEIHHVCLESNDAGAMYAGRNWTTRGHVIQFNHLYDITGFRDEGSVGVYLDDMFSSAKIYGNVFRNVTRAAMIGGGRDCEVVNNIFIDCKRALHIDARGLGWAHTHPDKWLAEVQQKGTLSGIAYDKPPYAERYPQLAAILQNEPKAPVGNTVTRNIFVGDKWDSIHKEARPYVTLKNNHTDGDPGFVSPQDHDYRLTPSSPANELGFEPIPFGEIGLFESELRASPAASRAGKSTAER